MRAWWAWRVWLSLGLLLAAVALAPATAHAGEPVIEPDFGNQFMCGQHALAAEGRNQPFENLLDMARVLRGKGMCFRGRGWLTSYDLAQFQVLEAQHDCIRYYACQGFFLLETIDPAIREPIALAVHVALTENPRIELSHFDRADSAMASWWEDKRACPNGWYVRSDLRFC